MKALATVKPHSQGSQASAALFPKPNAVQLWRSERGGNLRRVNRAKHIVRHQVVEEAAMEIYVIDRATWRLLACSIYYRTIGDYQHFPA